MSANVGIIMGSQSDWETMRAAAEILDTLDVAHEVRIVSAHRTPDRLWDYGKTAVERGLQVIIAAGAANAGLMAAGILALNDAALANRLDAWRAELSASIPDAPTDD